MRRLCLWFLLICAAAQVRGQVTNAPVMPELTRAQTALEIVRRELDAAGTAADGASELDAVRLRRVLVRHLQRQVDEWKRLPAAVDKADESERNAAAWSGFAEKPPFAVRFVDGLRDTARAAELQVSVQKSALELLRQAGESSASALKAADQKVRAAAEALERASRSPDLLVRAQTDLELARLQLRIEQAVSASLEAQLRVQQAGAREAGASLKLARQQLSLAEPNIEFTEKERDAILADLDKRRTERAAEARTAAADEEKAQQAADEARDALRRAEALPEGESRLARVEQARAALEPRLIHLETAGITSQFKRGLVELVTVEREMWHERFDLAKNSPPERVAEAARKADTAQLRLAQWQRYLANLTRSNQAALTEEQRRADGLTGAAQQAARARIAEFELRDRSFSEGTRATEGFERLLSNFRADLQTLQTQAGLKGRARDWGSQAVNGVKSAWNFELFSVNDSIEVDGHTITGRRGITVGKVFTALVLLVGGLVLTQIGGRFLERFLVTRLHRSPESALAVRNWSVFAVSLLVAVAALMWARIPVTVFAFMGGALALGFGFGVQNLMSNFISGLILVFDKPIRVGDLLETQGVRGAVTQIGLRYSILKRADGVELLIPNKDFLEKTVTNFTLNDPTLRQTIVVGVNYGSPTRAVKEVLLKVAGEHGLVLKAPAPVVLLDDFGADALVFGLYYWIDVSGKTPGPVIASDLRFMIEQSLKDRGISLAFPQRDVHLATPVPIRVTMSGEAPNRPE